MVSITKCDFCGNEIKDNEHIFKNKKENISFTVIVRECDSLIRKDACQSCVLKHLNECE